MRGQSLAFEITFYMWTTPPWHVFGRKRIFSSKTR